MKNKVWASYLIGLFLIGLAGITNASTIYDNGMGYDNAYLSSTTPAGTVNHTADDFILSTTDYITDVHWRGTYAFSNNPYTDDFIIRIYADNGSGMPTALNTQIYTDNVGSVNRSDTNLQITNNPSLDVYEYWTYIDPFYATGGVTYWLEIYNNAIGNDSSWYWAAGDGGNGVITNFGSSWIALSDEEFDENQLAFQLTSEPVPEPATMLLLGTGLVGVAGAARRRKKKNQA